MSSSIEPRVLVSICETNLNDQFKPSFRDNRDRNSQQETTSLPTRWNKNKKRDASRVVYKTFREDMSYPASARNIPNNNIRRAKASWQDDGIDITYHQTHMPNQPRQVMSPNPHSLDIQRHVSERTDRHSLLWRRVRNQQKNRWRRSTASQISVATLLHRLESVERQNEELRQRISEMDRSNPSSIHGTETTSYPAGSLSEIDTSNQRESDHHDGISEPVAGPEIRRMTPSDDVESEIDDLHRWYTMRASEIEENRRIELAQSSASSTAKIDEMSVANGNSNDSGSNFDPAIENLSAQRHDSTAEIGNGEIDAKSDTQIESLGDNRSNDAIFIPTPSQSHALMSLSSGHGESSASSSNSQAQGEHSQIEVEIGSQSNLDPSDNSQGGTGPIQASESPKSEKNSAEQHLHESTVTYDTTSAEKWRIRCRKLMDVLCRSSYGLGL